MKAHLFLRDNQLFITTEAISEKPLVKNFPAEVLMSDYEDAVNIYNFLIASIKERSTLVRNQDEILFSNLKIILRGEGDFYPIDCKIRYEPYQCPEECNCTSTTECKYWNKEVAILSPISSVSEKTESENELWVEAEDIIASAIGSSRNQLIEWIAGKAKNALKSRFTITRKS